MSDSNFNNGFYQALLNINHSMGEMVSTVQKMNSDIKEMKDSINTKAFKRLMTFCETHLADMENVIESCSKSYGIDIKMSGFDILPYCLRCKAEKMECEKTIKNENLKYFVKLTWQTIIIVIAVLLSLYGVVSAAGVKTDVFNLLLKIFKA